MNFDPLIQRELTVGLELNDYLRIIPRIHRATPLGMRHSPSRFSSSKGNFTLLYAARDLPTAVAERIVRDRFQGQGDCIPSDMFDQHKCKLRSKARPLVLHFHTH